MNRIEEAEAIRVHGPDGEFIWLSEKAERRLSWILTGFMMLITAPVFALAFMV